MPGTTRRAAAADSSVNLDEIVAISHPDTNSEGVCTRRQLQDLWSSKGWVESDTAPEEVAAAAVDSLASVTDTSVSGAATDTTGA